MRITFDFETRSKADLKKQGAYKYSLDPTTMPTCLAFKTTENSTIYFLDYYGINRHWNDQLHQLRSLWLHWLVQGAEFSAHNAGFERCIYENILVKRYGWPLIPARQYRCTAAKAAACALPRNLEGAGAAMNLSTQKDKRGYVAMMATCKPTKQWNAWTKARAEIAAGKKVGLRKREMANGPEPLMFITPKTHPEVFETLYTYCKIDVRTEELLDQSLPDLNMTEQAVWHLNQKLNWRGLNIDIPTARKVVDIMAIENKKKLTELDSLTMGLVTKPGARKSVLEFLALEGIELPDLKAKTVGDKLDDFDLSENMRRLLEIRKALSLTSIRKYQSFIDRSAADNRARDILLYHGASTGRDTGTGIQIHNFPRGLLRVDKSAPYAHVENVVSEGIDALKLFYGDDGLPILFSAVLRNMILPSKGAELFVADFSKIEVAVLWWVADNWPGLKILNSGKDPYIFMAAKNTGKSYEEIEAAIEAEEKWAIDARQLGKAQVLGNGFGMGAPKFKDTAWVMYRLKLTDEEAKMAVANYRHINAAVPVLWKAYEAAATAAAENPLSTFEAGKCSFQVKKKFLWVTLPSGRKLAYREPQIAWRETDYGPRKTLEFMAVNSKTKKWSLERTWGGTLTENIVQAVARDLMMYGAVRLEDSGYKVLTTVHDEAICEKEKGTGDLKEFVRIMCERPSWADKHLPIEAKGWQGPRYRK